MLSDSPPERDIQWSDEGISGSYKFIQKIWNISETINNLDPKTKMDDKNILDKSINKLIKDVTLAIESFHFNVAVAKFYEFINILSKVLHDKNEDKIYLQNCCKIFNFNVSFYSSYCF